MVRLIPTFILLSIFASTTLSAQQDTAVAIDSLHEIVAASSDISIQSEGSASRISLIFRGLIGMISLIIIAVAFSTNRKAISIKLVFYGLLFQVSALLLVHLSNSLPLPLGL